MGRKRWGKIWRVSSEEFARYVKESVSYAQVLRRFGMQSKGNNWRTLKKRIEEENVDCSHFGKNYDRIAQINRDKKIPLSDILVKNSSYSRGHLKKRLIKGELIEYRCSIDGCQNPDPVWNGSPIVLILDHANGISDDNRIENLRFVCPNCNSQLPTHAGRKNKIMYYCKCGGEKGKHGEECDGCARKKRRTIDRPSVKQLLREIDETNYSAVGRKYGVSDNAIRKWIK